MLIFEIWKSSSAGSKYNICCKERLDNWNEDTAVKFVIDLNKFTPSSCSGIFSVCEKIVILSAPEMDDSRHW